MYLFCDLATLKVKHRKIEESLNFFFFLDHPIMMGFEPLVNQRLLPPTFPRYAKIIKREEMVNYFSRLIERIKTVCEVVNLPNLHCILVSTDTLFLF